MLLVGDEGDVSALAGGVGERELVAALDGLQRDAVWVGAGQVIFE